MPKDARKRTGFYRVAFFVPVILPMVVIAVLWAFVLNPDFGPQAGQLLVRGVDVAHRGALVVLQGIALGGLVFVVFALTMGRGVAF